MWVIQMRYWQMSLFGHILDIRLLDHFLEYFLDFLLDHFFRPFWSFLGRFFYYSLLRRGDWIYLSSVGEGGGRGRTCDKCSCHFFGYFTGSYKFGAFFPLIFFWLSKILGRAGQVIFFLFCCHANAKQALKRLHWREC